MTFAEIVVVGLHLPWDGVWQRPNHVLSRIARDVPVLVVEESRPADRDETAVRSEGNVTVISSLRAAPHDALDAPTIERVRDVVRNRTAVIWLYTPMMLGLSAAFGDAPIVYDKMDELAQFAGADPRLRPRETELLAHAACVFTGGRSLHASVRERAQRAACYPSGVDIEHFARARSLSPHADLAPYAGRPVYGYVGVVDERLDLALIAHVAAHRPDAVVVLVGPVAKIDERSLPRAENIVYLGARPYAELPSILAGFDVALMPFALNEHTEMISPTKTLEYLAAGKPVVSTRVPDVVADHADVVAIADDAAQFTALLPSSGPPSASWTARVDAKLRGATWDRIVDAMRADLKQAGIALGADQRPARSTSIERTASAARSSAARR